MLRWTVYVRSTIIVFFAAFGRLGFASAPLVLFAVVDLLGAFWTHTALRAEGAAVRVRTAQERRPERTAREDQ